MYTLGKIIQEQERRGVNNVLPLSTCTESLRHESMEKWVVEKVVGTWDQRKDVENDEK